MFWAYVPHFIHSPFYVYAYAFGDCLVNALYSVFQSGHPGFQAKYLDMLRAGGTKRHKELLAPFGLDASDPAFWKKGLDVIAGFIDELEQIGVKRRRAGKEAQAIMLPPSPCGRGSGGGGLWSLAPSPCPRNAPRCNAGGTEALAGDCAIIRPAG